MAYLIYFLLFLLAVTALLASYFSRYELPQWLQQRVRKKACFSHFGELFTDQPDAAVESFIQAVPVNEKTLETHLQLAKMMRSQGKIDQAIKLHQNLLGELTADDQNIYQTQFQLAVDYRSAGWLDRAERQFLELLQGETGYREQAAKQLISIYRDEKEWEKALRAYDFMQQPDLVAQAQVCCELADIALALNDASEARRQLERARDYNPDSPRAYWGLARLAEQAGDTETAWECYISIAEKSPDLAADILPALLQCARLLSRCDQLTILLERWLEKNPGSCYQLALVEILHSTRGEAAAETFLEQELVTRPSYQAVASLLEYYQTAEPDTVKQRFAVIRQAMAELPSNQQVYRCNKCGFKGQQLHWLCPKCKSWETLSLEPGVQPSSGNLLDNWKEI